MEQKLELVVPDFSKEFTLEGDASEVGLGAVLRQGAEPISYISRALKGAEVHYSITEKELLAVTWAMGMFEHFLKKQFFIVVTDHEPLKFLITKREFGTSRIRRWFNKLQRFTFKVIYRPGVENVQSDALSRCIDLSTESNMENQILQKHRDWGHRKCIKHELKQEGFKVSTRILRRILDKCTVCAKYDVNIGNSISMVSVAEAWELVGIDLLEINKKSRILVIIDYLRRYICAEHIRTKDSKSVLALIDKFYNEHKFKGMICDNGGEFNNKILIEWARNREINRRFSIPYCHPSNGRVKRANRTLRNMLQKMTGSTKNRLEEAVKYKT